MSNTQKYKVISIGAPIKSQPSLFASTVDVLKQNTLIEVISINGIWAYFKYKNKNAYIFTYFLEKVEQTTNYSITNYLENCTNNNSNTSIVLGNSYNATLIPNTGYEFKSIRVQMNEVDITDNVYSDGVINISVVDGDIVITATAITSGGNVTPEPGIPDSEEYQTYLNEMNDNYKSNQSYIKEDETGAYVIPLSNYSISNNGTNANATTKGINNALQYAKNNGYNKVKLPAGTYLIDSTVTNSNMLTGSAGNTWTHNFTGVYVPSNITLIMEGATLKLEPTENPHANVVNFSKSDNAKIIGGTIIGDRENHDYGMRINNTGGEFERGDISTSTGANIAGTDCIRTKNFITNYVDWFSKSSSSLPSKFHITPLWNTTRNTVDGSEVIVYFYNSNNSLVSTIEGDFLKEFVLPSDATKMKFVIKQETRLDAVVSVTKRLLYYTYESGCGICVTASNNVTIKGVKIYDCIGDCIGTNAPPIDTALCNDIVIENCTLENSRRQGISFVATGDRPIVRNCNIGKINGVDPQCGIDFEHYKHVDGVIIEGCNFYDNKKWDIINYNGTNITIKNNYFNGTLAFTYGRNMDVYNNKFLFNDHFNNIYKSYNEVMYFNQWGTEFEKQKAYYNVHGNIFIGYNAGYNNTSVLTNINNHYKNNTFINCNWLRMQYSESNTFKNCTIEYIFDSNKTLDASTFIDCTIYKRSAYNLDTSKCTLNNSTVKELTSTSTTPTSINIPSTFSIKQGESKTIPMMIVPTTALRDGEPLTKEVRWESSDWSKVYVSEIGTVYAIGNPEGVTITCTSRVNANAKGSCTLTLNASTVDQTPDPEPTPDEPTTGGDVTLTQENINIARGRGTLASFENNKLTINMTKGDRTSFNLVNLQLEDDTDYVISCSFDEANSTACTSKTKWEAYTGGIQFQHATSTEGYNNISLSFNSRNWSTATKPSLSVAVHGMFMQGLSIFKDIIVRKKNSYKYYKVIYTLSNATSSNQQNKVKENVSYNTIISPMNGYTISSITVTMGGTNITSQVINGNSISIPSVTGNVVITATSSGGGNTPVTHPSDGPIEDVSTLSYDITTVPQITHYYYPGKQKVSNSETIIPIYFTDYYQREYYYEDTSLRFDLRTEVDGQVKWMRNLQAGEHDISLGVLGVGEHDYSLEVTQTNNGLRSQRLFNKVWVVDNTNNITAAQTYNVTSSDLTRHNITLNLTSSATATQLRNNRLGLTSLFEEYHSKGYRKIVLPANSNIRVNMMYAGETETYPETWDKRIMPKPILIPTNTTIDMNGSTIKMQRFSDTDYPIEEGKDPEIAHVTNEIIRFMNCIDSHLINGTIEGNYNERLENPSLYLDGSNGEHDGGITMYGGGWNTLENFTIKQVAGYNLSCAKNPDIGQINGIWLQNSYSYPAGFEGCWDKFVNTDLVKGVETPKQNRLTSDFISLSSFKYDFFSVGAPGSSYPTGYYYEVLCTFYDENKQYIDDFIAYQARVCKLPVGAKYARFTINAANFDEISNKGFFVFPGTGYYSEYNEWKNIEFIDNRTCCNPNMFKHLRITNCNFTRSGQSITPLAIDSEDGGAGMQDLFIDHCSIKEHATTQTGDCVSVGGLNVVIQDNTNMSFGIRAEVIGATLRNNTCSRRNSEIQKGWRTRNTVRCYNNEFKGWNEKRTTPILLSLILHNVTESKDAQIMIKKCKNLNYGNGNDTNTMLRQNLIFKDCEDIQMGVWAHHINDTFYINSQDTDNSHRTGNCTFDKCTFTRKATGGSMNTKILSFNYGTAIESMGTYNNCIFNFLDDTTTVQPDIQNAFVKGEFNNCTFKTPMIFKLLYANNMGDIKFNNCKFVANLTLDLKETKVQFNGCTFNGISYLNNGKANSEFNDSSNVPV